MISRISLIAAAMTSLSLAADDWPDFDRPGILFAPSVLPVGVWSLELGLPELSRTNQHASRIIDAELHTMLRYGVVEHWELQLELAPYSWRHTRVNGDTTKQSGYSDARLGSRYDVSHLMSGWFFADAVALQAGIQLKTGHRDFTESSQEVDLGIVVSWDLGDSDHEVDVMVQGFHASDNTSWFLATTYGAPVLESVSAFVETGVWLGDSDGSVLGAGLIWRPSAQMQLDSYVLQRLSGDVPDTQWGLGFSWMFF
ncbi:MAG: transporter [Alkalimonas sp.]|nr:transporter [Alkalimonas sp.]